MTNKIFKSILLVAIIVLMASLLIITGVLYQYFGNIQELQLKDVLGLAADATTELGVEYLKKFDSERYRLTWIDEKGKVIFDSNADITEMENHKDREEVREAFLFGEGSSIRKSFTLTEQTIYEAVRLEDGTVLRISISRLSAVILMWGMLQPITVVVVIAIILSAWLAGRMAKRAVEPLNNLNLEKPMENEVYEELIPLLYRIHAQHLEIKSQMKKLQEKKDEFEQITENMKEGLVLLDQQGKILSINPAGKILFNTDDFCVGKEFLTIDKKQKMEEALSEAKLQGNYSFREKIRERHYQFDLRRIDSQGSNSGMIILVFDITDQVNAEKHRREFTANVSHELKTPLQSIIGSAELMENGIVKEEDFPRFVGHIRKEAERLVHLINDIIHLSQLDEGSEMPGEYVSLKELSMEVAEILRDAAKFKNITLTVAGDEGKIFGVHRLLYEIIYNLCDNAIKYNLQDGKVKIRIKEEEKRIILSVEDTGIGIDPFYHEKVFERFYRIDKSHSKQSGGTGLGLSIVKHAVQYHRGKILMESEQERGTKVSIIFPCEEESPENQADKPRY